MTETEQTMNSSMFESVVRGRVEELKALYAELFVLMEENLARGPENGDMEPVGLDAPLAELMRGIASKNEALFNMLAHGGDWRAACTHEFCLEVDDFQSKLQSGLEAMYARVRERIDEVARARDEAKSALRDIQERQVSRRAYAPRAKNAPSMLISSKV
jgi:hypothetical protein